MVSSTLVDAIASPSDTLKDLYRALVLEEDTPDFPAAVSTHFSSIFGNDEALGQIPGVDVGYPPQAHALHSLVRFRAMVQDTSNSPEIYMNECGWGIEFGTHPDDESEPQLDYDNLRERNVLWAVNIPGEATWCAQSTKSSNHTNKILHVKSHKFPIPDTENIGMQIKIYTSAEAIVPTSIHTFVGILTSEPEHSESASDKFVPTLHVLFHSEIPKTLVSCSYPSALYKSGIREALLSWLANEALGGDRDAAEWVLLCCIASVQSRNPPLLPPSLTLSMYQRPSSDEVPTLSWLLAELLPLFFSLQLSLDLLNDRSFEPESKEEDLHSGILQVPSGTTVIVTECGVKEGRLSEKGLRNVQALQDVAKLQTLKYNFPFSQFSFPTDINVIVLTDGRKSIFCDTSIVVPLLVPPSSDLYKPRALIQMPTQKLLASFRELIVSAKHGNVTVGAAVSEMIQVDFVQERRRGGHVTPDDLARQMSIARLMALSRHEQQLTTEIWASAKELDHRRKSRFE